MQQERKRKFIVVFWDGPMNGGERYFCSSRGAINCGLRYIARCKDYPCRVGFDVYFLDDNYRRHCIYSRI